MSGLESVKNRLFRSCFELEESFSFVKAFSFEMFFSLLVVKLVKKIPFIRWCKNVFIHKMFQIFNPTYNELLNTQWFGYFTTQCHLGDHIALKWAYQFQFQFFIHKMVQLLDQCQSMIVKNSVIRTLHNTSGSHITFKLAYQFHYLKHKILQIHTQENCFCPICKK